MKVYNLIGLNGLEKIPPGERTLEKKMVYRIPDYSFCDIGDQWNNDRLCVEKNKECLDMSEVVTFL